MTTTQALFSIVFKVPTSFAFQKNTILVISVVIKKELYVNFFLAS